MDRQISFQQVSAALGSFLLLWAKIEQTTLAEASRLHKGKLPKV